MKKGIFIIYVYCILIVNLLYLCFFEADSWVYLFCLGIITGSFISMVNKLFK